ncbi:Metal transporter cnnm2 [Halocaridina rubra]|uniref:Metal transporter cnnm2 n=1 Tax=Halocaridina rubra TaxID=373956 RepID=A0AAN9A0X6_HALRR
MDAGSVRTLKYVVLSVLISVSFNHCTGINHIEIYSISVERGASHNNGGYVIEDLSTELVIFGRSFLSDLRIALTSKDGIEGEPCLRLISDPITATSISSSHASFALTRAHLNHITKLGLRKVWVCMKRPSLIGPRIRQIARSRWVHLGHVSTLILIPSKEPFGKYEISTANDLEASVLVKRDTHGKSGKMVLSTSKSTPEEDLKEKNIIKEDIPSSNITRLKVDLISHDEQYPKPLDIIPENPSTQNSSSSISSANLKVSSLRVESHDKGLAYDDFSGSVMIHTDAEIRFFGQGFSEDTEFLFTSYEGEFGTQCGASTTKFFKVNDFGVNWATSTIQLPSMEGNQTHWYLCAREGPEYQAYHQGNQPWLTLKSYPLLLPVWLQACFIVILLCLSGIFSGLNLGLMALDKTELSILANAGSDSDQRYAKAIQPVRAHGNYLLCTLLLGNVLVNSTLTILLDGLSTGLIAVIGSTIGIVLFGEIFPQAVCSRHGLAVGAHTVWLVRIFMVLTGPMSWPISKILDLILGEEIGNMYNRDRLKELILLTHGKTDIRTEEKDVICAALEFHKKTVSEIMTKIGDIYMLNIEASLDFNTIHEMMQHGYSRIPVYDGQRTNIVSVLFIKDLAFIDPDDNIPLKTLCQFYQNPLQMVPEDTPLDSMLKDFKEGIRGHMAFVYKVNISSGGHTYHEVVGLVTLEDVIEELIQAEIVDETDVFTDNRKRHRRRQMGRRDFTEFSQKGNETNTKKHHVSSQMQVAAFQFLRTSVDPFKEGQLSESIVKRLISQDIVHSIKVSDREESKSDANTYIYAQGKPADYFVLILEGHVEVCIGKEGLTFENGPFTFFGLAALPQVQGIGESPLVSVHHRKGSIRSIQSLDSTSSSFVPDYSVRAISEVLYLKISCSHYVAARRAFFLELSQKKHHEDDIIMESTQPKYHIINTDIGLVTGPSMWLVWDATIALCNE